MLRSAAPIGTNVTVTWQSMAGATNFLERSTNLLAKTPLRPLAINLPGQPGTTSFTDTNAARPISAISPGQTIASAFTGFARFESSQ